MPLLAQSLPSRAQRLLPTQGLRVCGHRAPAALRGLFSLGVGVEVGNWQEGLTIRSRPKRTQDELSGRDRAQQVGSESQTPIPVLTKMRMAGVGPGKRGQVGRPWD